MVYLTFSTVMTIIGFQCPFILIQFGWFVSWTYLRFYKKNAVDLAGGGISYGDRSETFSFVNWFPPLLQYVSSRLLSLFVIEVLPLQLSRVVALEHNAHSREPSAHHTCHVLGHGIGSL